jgi:hypothetical protein
MAASAIEWPAALVPSAAMFHPDMPSRSGGASLSGSEQVNVSPAGRWRARLEIPVHTETKVLAHRALIAQLSGRAGTVLVPKWEMFGPKDSDGRRLNHRNAAGPGSIFDGSGYGQSDLVYATVTASAAAFSTRVIITLINGEGPRPGQYIGFRQRLHLVQGVWQETEGEATVVQFWPQLREVIPAGEVAILDRPVCLMRLAADNSGELMLDQYQGQATLEFVEAY